MRETEFDVLLRSLQPTEQLFKTARALFEKFWAVRLASSQEQKRWLTNELEQIERKLEKLLDQITETETASVRTAFC
jgi:site-specific DNA recombinase